MAVSGCSKMDVNSQVLRAQINKLRLETKGRQVECTNGNEAYNFCEGAISAYEEVMYLLVK